MILSGKDLANKIKDEIKYKIDEYLKKPILAVISIGEDEASNIYINNKRKACEYVGISFLLIKFKDNEKEEKILQKIQELNNDQMINGIIVQLPIPKHLDKDKILNKIDPCKDVDGLTKTTIGSEYSNFIPCTPKGIMEILNHYKIEIAGKNIVIIGRSNLVGKPLASLLLKRDATVTICHSKTHNLKEHCLLADIIIVAVGKPSIINKFMIKKGATIIDVGINRINGKLYGDADDNIKELDINYTPVPGGVGPMTVVMLMKNTLEAYKRQNGFFK